MILASQVYQDFRSQGLITSQLGLDASFSQVQPAEQCGAMDLVFADNDSYVDVILKRRPAVVVTQEALGSVFAEQGFAVLVSPNVKLAHALIRQKYTDTDFYATEWPRIHPAAQIHTSVTVDASCVIGPGAVIGAQVALGKRCVVMAHAVIEHDAIIGDDTIIHPHAIVGWGCEIGARVFLKAGCVIGSEGYGFAQDEQRKSHRIPQQGNVVIESDCVIGANCCIDRATYEETRIRTGCKLDNLCHIAHNVLIGEDGLLTAQVVIAGSTTIGKRVIMSGQAGVLDHITIADDVVLLHRAGVTRNVPEPGMYASIPLQPLRSYTKNVVVQKKLVELQKRVKQLEKSIETLSTKQKD